MATQQRKPGYNDKYRYDEQTVTAPDRNDATTWRRGARQEEQSVWDRVKSWTGIGRSSDWRQQAAQQAQKDQRTAAQRWQEALANSNNNPELLLMKTRGQIHQAQAKGLTDLASQLQDDLDFYETYWAQQQEDQRKQGVLDDWSAAHENAYQDWMQRYTGLGEDADTQLSGLQSRYSSLQEKAADRTLSPQEQETYQMQLSQFEREYGELLKGYGIYSGVTNQQEASVAEAQAELDRLQEERNARAADLAIADELERIRTNYMMYGYSGEELERAMAAEEQNLRDRYAAEPNYNFAEYEGDPELQRIDAEIADAQMVLEHAQGAGEKTTRGAESWESFADDEEDDGTETVKIEGEESSVAGTGGSTRADELWQQYEALEAGGSPQEMQALAQFEEQYGELLNAYGLLQDVGDEEGKSITDLTADREALQAEYDKVYSQLYGAESGVLYGTESPYTAEDYEILEEILGKIDAIDSRITDTGSATSREDFLSGTAYAEIVGRGDFVEKSQPDTSVHDATYQFINNVHNNAGMGIAGDLYGDMEGYGWAGALEKYAYMTPDEVGVYNYIYRTEDRRAANKFLESLEISLDKSRVEAHTGEIAELQEGTEGWAGAGLNAALSIGTVLAAPARGMFGGIATIQDIFRTAAGKPINPYSSAMTPAATTSTVRGETTQEIKDTVDGFAGEALAFLYNVGMSAGDSATNRAFGLGLGNTLGAGDVMKFSNILSSLLMSSDITAQAVAEGVGKDYSDAGSVALALIRGGIAYATEAIGGEFVIKYAKQNPLNFLKTVWLSMIPEGVEEVGEDVANEMVSLTVDALFGTQESEFKDLYEYYKTAGTPWQQEHPELMMVVGIAGIEGLNFLSGALATVGSGTVYAGNVKAGVTQVAEGIGWSGKDVVDCAQALGTDDYGAVAALAQFCDATSYADLQEKIGDVSTMSDAVEKALSRRSEETAAAAEKAASASDAEIIAGEVLGEDATDEDIAMIDELLGEEEETATEPAAETTKEPGETRMSGIDRAEEKTPEPPKKGEVTPEIKTAEERLRRLFRGEESSPGETRAEAERPEVEGDLPEKRTGTEAKETPTETAEEPGKTTEPIPEHVEEGAEEEASAEETTGGQTEEAPGEPKNKDRSAPKTYSTSVQDDIDEARNILNWLKNPESNTDKNGMTRAEARNRLRSLATRLRNTSRAKPTGSTKTTPEGRIVHARFDSGTGKAQFTIEDEEGNRRIVGKNELTGEAAEAYNTLEDMIGQQAPEAFRMMNEGQSPVSYAIAFRTMMELGRHNVPFSTAPQFYGTSLTETQAKYAYTLGQGITNREGGVPIRSVRGTGKVSLEGGVVDGVRFGAVQDKESFVRSQRYKDLQDIAKTLDIDFVIYESKTDKEGRFMGAQGVYDNGVIYLDINAGRNSTADSIRSWALMTTLSHELTHFIAQNASKKTYAELEDFVTRYLIQKSGVDFNQLIRNKMARDSTGRLSYDGAKEEVIADACETMLLNSQAVQDMAREKPGLFTTIKKFIDRFTNQVLNRFRGEDYARHDEAKALQDVASQVQQIWDKALKEAVANRVAGNTEQEMVDKLGEDAEVHLSDRGELLAAVSEDRTTAAYSERTYRNGGREKLAKILAENGHTEAEIRDTLETIDAQLDFLHKLGGDYAANMGYEALANHLQADIMTYIKSGERAQQALSTLVNNGEYPVNLDLALICKKRVAYMRMMTKLIEDGVFEHVTFAGEAIADVNKILRDNGFETACLGCFVESRRLQLQKWAETIVEEWNRNVDKRKPNAEYFNFAEGLKEFTDKEILDLVAELEAAGEKNDKKNVKLDAKSVEKKMGELQDRVPTLQKKLTVADLLTPKGMSMLRTYDQNLFSLVKQRYGAASPKIVQEFNPYNSEIAELGFDYVKEMTGNAVKGAREFLKQAKAETERRKGESDEDYNARVETIALQRYLYKIGGARIQSFSDFMIENVFDYLQIMNDLAARDLPLHGYSKEIHFLRLFGMTGMKLNGSWIAHTDAKMGKEFAGLLPASEASNGRGILVTVNGQQYAICMDDYARNQATGSFIQSIGMKDMVALELDPRYSANVGSITIGVSDNQILAMLDNDLFRMIIPYHASGMLPGYAKLVGVDMYNDYTNQQNTKIKHIRLTNGGSVTKTVNKKTGVEKFKNSQGKELKCDTSFAFNEAVQRLGDARAAADEYIAWCAQEHPVYDGDTLVGYATFSPKFSTGATDFSKHPNYYKLLEDFTSYDLSGVSALQGAVTTTLPSADTRLTAEQMEAYKQRLRDTGLFTEAEIEKYAKKADMTFEQIVEEEVKGRAEYESRQAEVWDDTVQQVEDMLLKKYPSTRAERKSGKKKKAAPKMSDRENVASTEEQAVQNDFDSDGRQQQQVMFSQRVTEPETLRFLNDQVASGNVVHTYKTFLEVVDEDGTVHLYPPMAELQRDESGKKTRSNSMSVGEWEESVGNPNSKGIVFKVNKKGETKWYYRLEKEGGTTVEAAYDPYQHSSNVVLNDQFEAAYQRPRLVTYECLIPKSELTSGYQYRQARADGMVVEAALPVGEHPWKKGTVAGRLSNTNRVVYLSRWLMPYRRLSNAEVAKMYKEILDNETADVSIPFNVVPPGLLTELERIGVPIDYEGSPMYKASKQRQAARAKNSDREYTNKADIDAEIERLQDRIRDIQNAQWNAREAAKRDPRVQEAQERMWKAEDEKGRAGSVRERMEYNRILKQVREEQAAEIPEGDLNELAQRVQELKELREQFLKVTPITQAQYDRLAKHFGTTTDYSVAGFILPDGRMLDFSGKKQYGSAYAGGREIYHNEVGDVLDLPTDTSPRINMVANGNIRLVPEINGINLSQKPTAKQRSALRGLIRHYNGNVHIDIDNAAGRTVETFGYYEGTSADKILSDIDNYFETGEAPAPQSNLRAFYSDREQDFDTESETYKAYSSFVDSLFTNDEVDEPGKLFKVRDDTPQVILDWDKSALNLPMMIRYDAAYLAARHDGTIKGHYHNLGDAVMKQLPIKLENPVLMLKLKNGRINSIIRLVDKRNRSVLVSVELNEFDADTRPANHLIVTVMGASDGNIRNLIEERGATVIYKTEEASHFISGLNHTTGNDLDTSSKKMITQDDGVVKASERDSEKTDRELLMDTDGATLTAAEKAELKKYRAKAEDFEARQKKVQTELEILDTMVRTHSPDVQKQRTKVSNLQAGMQKALRELTAAEKNKTMLEIIRKEREIQRRRTSYATRETFTRRELRGRITRLYNDLNRRITSPSEKKNIPVPVMEQAIEVLQAINMDSSREGSKAGEKLRDKLLRLKEKYRQLQNDPDFKSAATYDPVVAELLDIMIDTVGETPINRMSSAQMLAVYNALTALDKTARKALKIKMLGEERDAYQIAKQMSGETQSVKKPHKNFLAAYLNAQLTPERMFNRLGGYHKDSAWSQVYRMLNDGQLTSTQIQMEGTMIFDGLLEGKDFDRMIDPKETVDVGLKDRDGKAIPITRGMMIALYMHLQNEQNAKHISHGGLIVPNLRDYYRGRNNRGIDSSLHAVGVSQEIGELKDRLRDAETDEERKDLRRQMAEAEAKAEDYLSGLRASIERQLTAYDRKWIAAAQELFDVYSKGRLNETTMEVYGIKRATVEHYFPIWVSGDFLNTPFESVAKDMSLENAGFMKERVDSGKPMRLADISDVSSNQIRRVSQYCGLMPAVRNFQKIWGKVETGYRSSLQNEVRQKFGQTGIDYIENLMADLNGARRGKEGALADFFNAVRGNMAQASLTLSLRTALGQTASYPSAAAVVGWKALNKALVRGGRNGMPISRADQELIRKYSPLLWYRLQGYSSVELGDIANANSLRSRVWKKLRWATGWIQAFDGAVVGRLWYAAEYYVQDNTKLSKGTDAYYQKVAEVFNDIVERTQPDYTTMQRPDILRNPNMLVKQLTMFLTQRLQNFNVLYDAAATYSQMRQDAASGRATGADVAQARKTLGRAVSSQLVAAATITAFKFLADMILHSMNAYRDDDDELTDESKSLALLDMFIDSLTGNILGGGEVYDIIESRIFDKKYYGIDVAGVSTVADVIEAANKAMDAVTKDGATWQTFWKEGGHTLMQKVATLLGIPEANAEKIVKGIWYHAEDIMNGEPLSFEAGVDRTTAQQAHRLWRAYNEGNFGQAKKIREQVGDDEKLDKALATYIKQQFKDGEISQAQAKKQLMKWCGKDETTAEKMMREYASEVETGIKYANIGEALTAGDISEAEAVKMWQKYGGMDEIKAKAKASFTLYQQENPATKFDASSYQIWYTKYRDILTAPQYEGYYDAMKACRGKDKDGDGKADSGTVKAEKLKVIDALPISDEKKDALYLLNNWSQNTLKDAPWHKRSRRK